MHHKNRFTAAALGLFLTLASFGAAADDAAGTDLAAIRAQQIELRAEAMAAKGIFKDMDSTKRSRLISRQDQLLALIEGKASVAEFDDRGQVRAFNLLEEINALINDAEGNQVVCENVRKTGSHRKTKVCTTLAERRRLQQETEDHLRRENLRGAVKIGN